MKLSLMMAVFGILAVTLEGTWLSSFPTSTYRIDLIIVAVAAVSFQCEWKQAVPIIIFLGIISDAASAAPFGISLFSYLMVYVLVRAIISNISFNAGPGLFFWMATVSLCARGIFAFVLLAAFGESTLPGILMKHAPLQALIDATAGLAIVPVIGWYVKLSWEEISKPKGLVLK